MVKVGDTVKWSEGNKGMLSGKVTGGEKGKRWRIESKGKRYYVPKEDVKKGVVKKKKVEPKKKTPAPKKAEPKPVDKDLFQKAMGVMADVAKEKAGKEKKRELLMRYSLPQIKKAYKLAVEKKSGGEKTQTFRRNQSKSGIIEGSFRKGYDLFEFLKEKPKKDPTKKYILEGFYLLDDDADFEGGESGIPFDLEQYGFKFKQSYPSGLIALEANLSVDKLRDFVKENEENYEDYTRLYTETKRYKNMVWDGLTSD
jgi:hypothetical protein